MRMYEQLRQGDVFLERIDALPDGCMPVPSVGGWVILAFGEASGHAHAISATPNVQLLAVPGQDDRFLSVGADAPVHQMEQYQSRNALLGPRYVDLCCGLGALPDGSVRIWAGNLRCEVLVHEEHGIIPLEPALYQVRRQREYSPEAPRRVAD